MRYGPEDLPRLCNIVVDIDRRLRHGDRFICSLVDLPEHRFGDEASTESAAECKRRLIQEQAEELTKARTRRRQFMAEIERLRKPAKPALKEGVRKAFYGSVEQQIGFRVGW